ncbi:MAG: hypothetical protein HKN87_20885 [Saprospiraceae bacterium]|nr:hypothetical protein [Saprospiraceae bacterium]
MVFISLLPLCATGEQVKILYDSDLSEAAYAARKLSEALVSTGHTIHKENDYDYLVSLAIHSTRLDAEAFSILPEGRVITIYGGDVRGLIYGTLALAEQLLNTKKLSDVDAMEEKPNLAFRAIKYNVPWETYRPSSALDLHYETARDIKYWEAFLDMMVKNRFNVISLWNMHPYTFMIKSKNFPEASPWTAEELAGWENLYRHIFKMAKERALDTYIVHWSIFVSEAFANAHQVAEKSFYPHYYVQGDTSEIVRRYLRESVKQVLEEYPDLDGIGISHGEGMAGMTPLERQEWMDDVLIAGMLEADRPVKLIHRVPFSSNLSSAGSTSKDVEVVTRRAMEKLENQFAGPIWVEMKFNWSHAHSTPKLVKVHGGKLGDTYFKPSPKNYKITWQMRNEDFFALRWGVPSFIREHIALNGKADYVGGYFVGSECYIPAKDYFTAIDGEKSWTWAFERQWLFYKLWGRLLYNPETSDEVFRAAFNRRYGDQGTNLLEALSLASSTQLRLASLYDSKWDFTLYSEGFLALIDNVTKYITIDDLIGQPTMDPDYVSIKSYVDIIQEGGSFGAEKITPIDLANLLQRDNVEALALIKEIKPMDDLALFYEVADIKTWAHLGLHLAEKIRGGVALQRYRRSGEEALKTESITHLQKALEHWDQVIEITRPIYHDMPLTHYNHDSKDANPDNLFHWALIRNEVVNDVQVAKEATPF